eukprot:s144_g16.t2
MAALPAEGDVRALTTVPEAIRLLKLPAALWDAFQEQVGNPGGDLRVLSALPPHVVVQGIGQAQVGGHGLTAVEAAHVGLVWRVARMAMYLQKGGTMENFVDIDPWEPVSTNPPQAQVQGGTSRSSGLKEKVLKMAALVDQTDDSELMPPDSQKVHAWSQRYFQLMGDYPMEEEEPTDAQMAALDKRVNELGYAPYVDMGVWLPFGRRALKNQKLRSFFPVGDGTYIAREFPGPSNFQQWQASWKVFKVAAISLDICTMAALLTYEKQIEHLTVQWPRNWSLIAHADDKARAERLERLRRFLVADLKAGKVIPSDFQENKPWSTCFRMLAQDETYWNEQVRHPATSWLASGAKGAPMASAEAVAMAHFPGLSEGQESEAPASTDRDERRRQSNRDKRLAKRKRAQAEREELSKFRSASSGQKSGQAFSKGKGKGQGKDQSGEEICYSWAKDNGPCAGLSPGSDCKCKVKRVHKCMHCFSPGHTNAQCPKK